MKQSELLAAYHKVLSEARHIMALHRRIQMMMGVANADGDKLQKAIDEACRLEQENERTTILSGG